MKLRYKKIERLTFSVVITIRKLSPHFQGNHMVVKTNYPIRQILNKPDLTGRMMSWLFKLSEYDVNLSRGSIKS